MRWSKNIHAMFRNQSCYPILRPVTVNTNLTRLDWLLKYSINLTSRIPIYHLSRWKAVCSHLLIPGRCCFLIGRRIFGTKGLPVVSEVFWSAKVTRVFYQPHADQVVVWTSMDLASAR